MQYQRYEYIGCIPNSNSRRENNLYPNQKIVYIKSKCIEVYEGFANGLAKLVTCNQILGHVAVQDYIDFID